MAMWFSVRLPEQVRLAQSTAMGQQLRTYAGFMTSMMVLGLAAQLHAGSGWLAMAWQLAMGTLAAVTFALARRMRGQPVTGMAIPARTRHLVLAAGLGGACWALGAIAWVPRAEPQLAVVAAAVSMIFTMHAVAACYLFPSAVLAFSLPLFGVATFVCIRALDGSMAAAVILLIALHGIAALRLLRRRWRSFTDLLELDADRGRLDAMLHEQKVIAENAVQLQSRFLATASHDLRQPMHAITLYLDGLAEVELPERTRAAIADARVCAHDMNDMFRSLLDISRLDAHQAVPSPSTFALAPLLSRVEKEFTPLAASRGVRLTVRPCAEHVYSDPVMVERIALNFVSNAVRHTTSGRVLVACRVRGRSLRFSVYDTGKGIPESKQKVIFEEFHTLDPTQPRDNTGGLGLGLAIVHRLSQALRLKVHVRSTPGRGSMFAIDLPLVHVARSRSGVAARGPQLSGRMVVVVDDEPAILHAVSFILQTAGCDVVMAQSGAQALQTLAGSTRVPDLIVCDFELNDGRNGADVVQQLRDEFNVDIPALLVTGNTDGSAADWAAELGIPILYKPLQAEEMKRALEKLLTTEE
ncbi:MAG: hybrid sensor histidine kinase/response regulator [Comamonadaceae bacterium]|nr:MAG: hybrid sensor histidine kinase/response regulator [Comamonadaceae bacterium]